MIHSQPTKARRDCRACSAHQRRGAIIVLCVLFVVILLAMAAFSVDVAYMQLVRTELRSATDAAAKAGVEALVREQDGTAAITAAINIAAANEVAGKPLQLNTSDVVLGRATQQADGSWAFTAGEQPYSAVRVNSQRTSGSTDGAVALFFGGFLGKGNFEPTQTATAANMQQEICLVIDRSHSMCFDMSGVDWKYPKGTPKKPNPICYPPHASNSRWASLESAVSLFVDTTKLSTIVPTAALVTFGSEIGTDTAEYYYTGRTEVAVATDVDLTTDLDQISTAIYARGDDVMLGGTDISAGIDEAVDILTGPGTKDLAQKSIVLMTDGQWNEGRDPTLAAADAAAAGVTIHTITFLDKADQTTMIQVASITGGTHYHASSQAELEEAFEKLATSLPVALTE
ncbi:MAG: VWA domain-containing protein [Planctomycetales bacterium]|nr:VWA domain-containing protein [Planctomycetales bacterium]